MLAVRGRSVETSVESKSGRVGTTVEGGTLNLGHSSFAVFRVPVVLVLLLAVLAGCGESAAGDEPPEGSGQNATIGFVGWDESVAVSALAKVLLEDRLGYERVELRESEPDAVFEEVAEGELDAFPGVWMPRHEGRVSEVEDGAALFGSFLVGTTRSSLAVPAYMDIRALDGLEGSGAREVIGPSPGAAAVTASVPGSVLGRYGLEDGLDRPSTRAMIEDIVERSAEKEPFVFVAWSPHWMNQKYDFNYLEDPDGDLAALTQPSTLHILVNKDLAQQEPVAQALLDILRFNDYQLSDLELRIHQSGDPVEGARTWAEDNRVLTDRWVRDVKKKVGGG